MSTTLTILSQIMGWGYFVLWSCAFYPPIWLNIKLKSTEGISLDFLYLNTWGYLCWIVGAWLLYFDNTTREQYASRHGSASEDKHYPLMQFNDICFGIHGCFLTLLTLSQVYFWGYRRSPTQRVSTWGLTLLWGTIAVCVLTALSAWLFPQFGIQWVDFTYVTGSVKVLMSTCKYFPQLAWNYKRKSTKGFAIASVLLDTGGGFLSMGQLVFDGIINNDMEGIYKNVAKFLLAWVTIFFDVILMLQHYYWFRDGGDELPTYEMVKRGDEETEETVDEPLTME